MVRLLDGLRSQLLAGLLIAGLAGLVLGVVWLQYQLAFKDYGDRAFITGVDIFAVLQNPRKPAPEGIVMAPATPLPDPAGRETPRFADLPQPAHRTQFSLLEVPADASHPGARLDVIIYSPRLRYSTDRLDLSGPESLAVRFGHVLSGVAEYCSSATLYAALNGQGWWRIEGAPVWGCGAMPPDYRLPAAIGVAMTLMALSGWAIGVSTGFGDLAAQLQARRRLAGIQPVTAEKGPRELRDTVAAVNGFLLAERERLELRAELLSGVSHDLGTPATRLRLRTALIADETLRAKLQNDIDQMTAMIDGVLSFTRSELESDAPRRTSILALLQSVVDDYRDTGQPVCLLPLEVKAAEAAHSIFSGAEHHAAHLGDPAGTKLLAECRPAALRRALTNLIDNALKYGRQAEVRVEADAGHIDVHIEDRGRTLSASEMSALVTPFGRGANAEQVAGTGLGLAIADAIAKQHGGGLSFSDQPQGLRATFRLSRF